MAVQSQEPYGELIGVVSSDTLYHGDHRGYSLVVTRHKIFGAGKLDSAPNFHAYLGPGSAPSEALVKEAREIAETVIASKKKIEIPIGSIGQVLYRPPSLLSGGYVIIKTALSAIRFDLSVLYADPDNSQTSKILAASLSAVVGWRLMDGQKGVPVTTS